MVEEGKKQKNLSKIAKDLPWGITLKTERDRRKEVSRSHKFFVKRGGNF